MTVIFTHESGSPRYTVPGYFAADGNAAETSSVSGSKWRAHVSPDKHGLWHFQISILAGELAAIDDKAAEKALEVFHTSGSFYIEPTDKTGRDFRGRGRLQYIGKRYLQFNGTKEYFIKAGSDSPENLLACEDFDGTRSNQPEGISRVSEAATSTLKTWHPHIADWQPGDPTWKGGKGKGLTGALNYLAGKGCNAFSFLTYNAGGDGDDVWPFVSRNDKLHHDCSKLDQWQIVFDHAQKLGLYLHFKLQETEIDDDRKGDITGVQESLDLGNLGTERKLYLRELIARFGYEPALNWNLGEENSQTTEQQKAMAQFIHDTDPYDHHIVIHTFPDWQDRVYTPLLGNQSLLTGVSLQNSWTNVHKQILYWINESEKYGKQWVVANDEQNPHYTGVPPDSGYQGFNGIAVPEKGSRPYTLHDIRKYVLWGTLMAGGAGVEYYFGYTLPKNDLNCEDWRSRDQSWNYCRIALNFFRDNNIPFWEMQNENSLAGNSQNDNSVYCLAKQGEIYIIYLPDGGTAMLNLGKDHPTFQVQWFNPRKGGLLQKGSVEEISGAGKVSTGEPPEDKEEDWVILITHHK
ncbi:MAG: DUF5060 domain-containing protein [Bacteroidales bacterium]|nr:DUF5060 domain-containing protein [Bacteroidales bacterium]